MEWLKKLLCNIWFYIILIIVSLVAPFIINELYKYGQANDIGYLTLWGAEDVFAFLGDYLSFFGTIVLGAAAVFQTERANKLAEKAIDQTDKANDLASDALSQAEKANELSLQMHKLEQARFYSVISIDKLIVNQRGSDANNFTDTNYPNPKIINLTKSDCNSCHSFYHVDFIAKNESDFPIDCISVVCKGRFEDVNYGVENVSEEIYIAPHCSHSIRFIIPTTYFSKANEDTVNIDIVCQNIFGYETNAKLVIEKISKIFNYKYTYRVKRILDIPNSDYEDQ